MHPGELWVSKQRVQIVLEASKSVGAKGDVPKFCYTRSNAFPAVGRLRYQVIFVPLGREPWNNRDFLFICASTFIMMTMRTRE